jgi:hypothetical protein
MRFRLDVAGIVPAVPPRIGYGAGRLAAVEAMRLAQH